MTVRKVSEPVGGAGVPQQERGAADLGGLKVFPVSFAVAADSQRQAAAYLAKCKGILQDDGLRIFPPIIRVCCHVAAKDRTQAAAYLAKCKKIVDNSFAIYPPKNTATAKGARA